MNSEKLVLFTHGDQFQQSQLHLDYLSLERSLKNSILLFGKVTLPGSCILKSDLTYQLVTEAKELLKQGIIVPDLRDEYRSYGNYWENNRNHFKSQSLIKERAAFLDSNTQNIISFSGIETSNYLIENLITSLFYLKLNGDLVINWRDFEDFIKTVKKSRVSDRKLFLDKLRAIARPNKIVLSTSQAIYHTLGAFVTKSNPIWPQLYSDTFNKIRGAQQNAEAKLRKSKEALHISSKYKILDSIQELNAPTIRKIHSEGLSELQNLSFISNEILDALDWKDVIVLSKDRSAKIIRSKLFQNSSDDVIDLKSLLKDDKTNKQKISKTTKGITLASVTTGVVSCIDTPTITSVAFALSVAGLILTFGDLLMKSEVERYLSSYSVLGEKANEIAFKNKTVDRLRKL